MPTKSSVETLTTDEPLHPFWKTNALTRWLWKNWWHPSVEMGRMRTLRKYYAVPLTPEQRDALEYMLHVIERDYWRGPSKGWKYPEIGNAYTAVNGLLNDHEEREAS